MTTDAKTLYAGALHNTHAEESQGLEQMESQIKGLEHYPEYVRLLQATSRSRAGSLNVSSKPFRTWARARRPLRRT